MGLRERFGNGEAEPEAAEPPLKRTFALFERIKNALHDFRFYADPGIADAKSEDVRQMVRR